MTDSSDDAVRRRRIHYRAWHRGTREADFLIGGFFERYGAEWGETELQWFESLLDEQDVDIMAWAFGRGEPPARYAGPMVSILRRLDYIDIPR